MPLFDTHVHLTDSSYQPYLDSLLAGMRAMNIVACSVSVDLATAQAGERLWHTHRDIVRNFVGIHPEAAGRGDLDPFKQYFTRNAEKIDGVGEIGLDKTYAESGGSPYARQKEVFGAMLELAESFSKPVSIHSRSSLEDVLLTLPSFRLAGVALHWFAGSKKQLRRAMELGLYVSFGPAMVYSEDKQVLLQNALPDRILVETDGPVRFSRCFADLPASPTSFLVSVAAALARTLKMSYSDAAALLESNSLAYLSGQRQR